MKPRQRAWADVDLDAVRRNLTCVTRRVNPDGDGLPTRVMVVLKADAYGLGAGPMARAVEAGGAAMIGVGDSSEALELRRAGIRIPIVVLGAIVDGEIEAVIRYRIATTIHSADRIRALAAEARRLGTTAPVHLMVDTGMCRVGAAPPRALELLDAIHREPALELVGTATHFSSPDDPDFTRLQLERMLGLLGRARAAGLATGLAHAAASAALWSEPRTHLDMVRPGILLHGVDPGGLGFRAAGLQPALALRTQLIYLKDVPAGTPVGYGRTHVTREATRIATIPVGYNDGLSIGASNRGEVLIRGQRAPIVGRVSMDYAMLDVGGLSDVRVGDPVTLIGRDGDDEIRLEDAAAAAGQLVYELSCGLGKRVRRRYTGEIPPAPVRPRAHRPARVDFARRPN